MSPAFPKGLIEGFYGKTWSWSERAAFAPFLKETGFDFYIHAPKAARHLRKDWRQDFPTADLDALTRMAATYRDNHIRSGIGLSPMDYSANDRPAMQSKLDQINAIDPDILCILFDDMPGDDPRLAARQIDLVQEIAERSTARHFMVCPTYYCAHPILEKIFGAKPDGYLTDLGRYIPPDMDIFWSGEKVISHSIPADHLDQVSEQLQRRPFIWDNAFSNDAATTSRYLRPIVDYPEDADIAGQAFNGMNQAELFRLSLLHIAYGHDLDNACRELCGPEAGAVLAEALDQIAPTPLEEMDDATKESLRASLSRFDHPAILQTLDWLDGTYTFDPDCLTD